MITSSSKRIIKRSDIAEKYNVERYLPPVEQLTGRPVPVQKKPVFPHYSWDGKLKDEEDAPAPEAVPEFKEPEFKEPEFAGPQEKDPEIPEEEDPDPGTVLLERKRKEADELLETARRDAARILTEAAARAEEEQKEAREAGLREGYEAGYREGREKAEAECRSEFEGTLRSFQEDMRQALKSVETAKEHCVHTYLEELKDCAIAIGEKVIHISLRSSGEVIKQMIIAATEKLKKTAWVKIYIDKCDYDMMMEADADILDELSHLSDNIKFIVMDKEERGNCIIEMPEEIVDVSVNTQIENIKDILENVRV